LRDQFLDIKAPTERQKKGAEYGIKKTKQEQKQREKKPRGLIEYYGFGELEYNFGHVGLQYAKLLATEHDHVNAQVELITKQFKNRVEGKADESYWWGIAATLITGAALANRNYQLLINNLELHIPGPKYANASGSSRRIAR